MPEIATISRCRLCKTAFAGPSVAIVGQGPHGRLIQYMAKLSDHFTERHPNESQAVDLRTLEYRTMLRLANYDLQDAELADQRNFVRWRTRQATIDGTLPDAAIEQNAEQLAVSLMEILESVTEPGYPAYALSKPVKEAFKKKLLTVLTEMRDHYEEPNRYTISGEPPPSSENAS